MRNLLLTFVLILTFLASLKTAHCQRCLEPHETNRNSACDFEMSPCGWQPIDGNSTWRLAALYGNNYAEVPMSNKQENFTTRLYSPWLCPVQHKVYSMRFRYRIDSDSRSTYSLSVLLSTKRDAEPVKIWTATTLQWYFSQIVRIHVKCQSGPFQVVFEVEKINEEPCTLSYNPCDELVCLDDIEIKTADIPEKSVIVTCPSPPLSTAPPSSSTAQPPSSSPLDTLQSTTAGARVSPQGSSEGCLGAGSVLGAVAGVVVFEIIAIVVVVVVRRKMTGNNSETPSIFSCFKRSPKQNSPSQDASQAATIAVFDGYQNSPGPRNALGGDQSAYELTENPRESGNYYSAADVTTEQQSAPHTAPRPTGDESDGYNELSFATPRNQGAGTYDHLKVPGMKKY